MKIFLIFLFIANSNGILFTCDFRENITYDAIGQVYECQVSSIDTSDNSDLASYKGDHSPGKSDNDVKMFVIGSNDGKIEQPSPDLPLIPKGTKETFPNLIGVSYWEFSLSLTGDELKDFPNFEYLFVSDTNLERIPGNLFANNKLMKYIGFDYNKLKRIGEGLFDNLDSLEGIHLVQNECISRAFYPPFKWAITNKVLKDQCPDA